MEDSGQVIFDMGMSANRRRNYRLLQYSYNRTMFSTVLTAVAPLICTLVDGLCASNILGTDAFNAVNTVMPLANAVSVLTLICNMGGSVIAARLLASGQKDKANGVFSMALVSAVSVALLVILFLWIRMDSVCMFLCPEPSGAEQVRIYLSILLCYFLFLPFCTTLNNFVSVGGSPGLTSLAVLVANIVNVVLDIVLIVFFNMGIAGAAWATVISGLINVSFYIPHFLKGRSACRFIGLGKIEDRWHVLGQNLKEGVGFNIFYIVVNLFVLFCNSLIARTIGVQALPVFGLCIQFQSITFGVVVGVCIAGISHISRLQGENDNDGIAFVTRKSIRIVLVFFGILTLCMVLFPQLILWCFGMNEPGMVQICRRPLLCFGVYNLCFTFLSVYTTLVMQMQGHVGGKLFFIFGIGILSALSMLAWSAAGADKLWFGLVTGSIPMVAGALLYAYHFYRKDHSYTPLTMMYNIPVYVRYDCSMDYGLEGMPQMLKELKAFTEACQLPKYIIEHIFYCCNELCAGVGEQRIRNNVRFFDLSFIETDDKFRLVVKDNGSPNDPMAYDELFLEHLMESGTVPSQRDTRLYLIRKLAQTVSYNYIFGMNITILEWSE